MNERSYGDRAYDQIEAGVSGIPANAGIWTSIAQPNRAPLTVRALKKSHEERHTRIGVAPNCQ